MLFEVLLALALFVGAAAFALAAVRSVFTTLDRSGLRQEAVDLARSKLAELEAGLISITDLRGEAGDAVGSLDFSTLEAEGGSGRDAATGPRWRFEVKTLPSEFSGLTLIELTVRESRADAGGPARDSGVAGPPPMSYTLRQLIALRESEPEAYQEDELMEEGG